MLKSEKNAGFLTEKWILWITLWITVESYQSASRLIHKLCTICS